MLSEKQLAEYDENGFVILDYRMPKEDIEDIKNYHKILLEKHPEFRDYCPTLLKHDLNYLKYAKNPEILDCVKQVIGSNLAKKLIRDNNEIFIVDNLWRGKLENLNFNDNNFHIEKNFKKLDLKFIKRELL